MNRLTIRNLKLNKKRTIVTIFGIILATALITALAGLAESFRKTMIEDEKNSGGNYHYCFYNVPADEIKYFEENRNLENLYKMQNIGYAQLENSQNEDKPYIHLVGMDQKAFSESGVNLIEGRMPQNSNEIVIAEHIEKNGKVKWNIGEKIKLSLGKRVTSNDEISLSQSTPYSKDDEKFIKEKEREYEIVGIIERPNYGLENYTAPGYTVITYLEEIASEKMDVYVRYHKKAVREQEKVTAQILRIDEKILEKEREGKVLSDEEVDALNAARYDYSKNVYLMRWENFEMSDSNLSMLYSVCAVITIIIIVTSVFCIRNSFAISITEKMKQYGMLSSIGATSKQIRKNVFYEAMILGIIGIPLGVLSGIFASFVLIKVVGNILKESLFGVEIQFAISGIAVVISVILSLLTIYLSARSSAKKASKISPIEAIRSSQDIKIRSKKIKSPKMIKKIFGMGGTIAYKTLKRNKKKYRTTVISIVVSISIFIAMSSFIGYAFKASGIYYENSNYNLIVRGRTKADYLKFRELAQNTKIDRYSIENSTSICIPASQVLYGEVQKEQRKGMEQESLSEEEEIIGIKSVGEEEYKKYLAKLGLREEEMQDKAILMDTLTRKIQNDKGKNVYKTYREFDYKKGDQITGKINDKDGKIITIEIGKVTDEQVMNEESIPYLVVSEKWMEENLDVYTYTNLFIDTKQADALVEDLKEAYDKEGEKIINLEEGVRSERAMWLVISIFLYGFITVISLIGITNIFNTITTNMSLRSKEFAMLKAVGMTQREFKKMIRLESFFYGMKSLCIGIPIGVILSYIIYKAFAEGADMGFEFPVTGVFISIIAVLTLIGVIMHYSLKKTNKQNLIETIRQDNI